MGFIKVVRERFLPYFPGMTVQSLLTPEEREQVCQGKLKAFDREGHEIGLQGALSAGSEVVLRQVDRA
ncbi:MAG: hypothetical protein QHH30_03730 [candidate division NC10 bacterium]|nr:hypothetical protein [candidate division NC10 bacterium]